MAQKIVAVITKQKSFMDPIVWENLRISIACNGDRKIPKDGYKNDPNGIYSWEFSNGNPNIIPYRHFENIHQAIELGWRLLAPPITITSLFGGYCDYEWWLVRD